MEDIKQQIEYFKGFVQQGSISINDKNLTRPLEVIARSNLFELLDKHQDKLESQKTKIEELISKYAKLDKNEYIPPKEIIKDLENLIGG